MEEDGDALPGEDREVIKIMAEKNRRGMSRARSLLWWPVVVMEISPKDR
jgi:hypothetical protein